MSRTQVKENCGRCIWWDPPTETCRVGGPMMTFRGDGIVGMWPKTATTDWCGRFRECPQFALNREDVSAAALDA